MSAVVFVGPTLAAKEVASILDADCRPPAAQGDVYRAALERPCCIGLIDGYFDGVPSVWHKEILWAMAQGIRVYGSASIGALRAAELDGFGMRGVGRIFEDYRDGLLEDDDEVAVLHAPAELGFAALSEPMVSVRATLANARAAGIIGPAAETAVSGAAKALHYRDRDWPKILGHALQRGVGADEVAALEDWLPRGRIDAKREDAMLMLSVIASEAGSTEAAPAVGYAFERTRLWEGLTERVEAELAGGEDDVQRVIDELRLDKGRFEAVRRDAALRRLAIEEAERRQVDPDRRALVEEVSRHRTRHGLLRRSDLAGWLGENGLTESQYEHLIRESALARAGAELPPGALTSHIAAELKWSGEFAALRRRARAKADALRAAGHSEADASRAQKLHLALWYFEQRLGEPVPENLDDYARSVGLETREDLYRILAREYLYSTLRQDGPEGEQPV